MDLATVQKAKYFPELLPDAQYLTIPAAREVAYTDLRRFSPLYLRLGYLYAQSTDNVWLKIRSDSVQMSVNPTSLFEHSDITMPWVGSADYLALTALDLTGFGVSNYRIAHGLWVSRPTIAEKLRIGLPLAQDEQELADKLGIRNSVEKGVLPLPLDYLISREYKPHVKYVRSFTRPSAPLGIPAAPEYASYAHDFADPDEFLVLAGIQAEQGTVSQDVRIIIDRDEDAAYLTLKAYALPTNLAGNVVELPMFVPALKEIRVRLQAAVTMADFHIKVSIWHVKMTNIHRARFGLPGAPADVIEKVRAGVV